MKSFQIQYQSDPHKSDLSLTELLLRIQPNLRANWKDIHKGSGVYIVYHTNPNKIKFNSHAGSSNSSTVDSLILYSKWRKITSEQETDIIYIGKGNVRSRIRALSKPS